jgi:hypothetical protein
MKKTLKDSDLKQLLADVATEVEGLVKAEAATLAKAHPGEDTSAEVPEDESASAPSGPPADASASAPPAPGGDEGAMDAPPADATGAPPADGSAPAGPDAGASADPAADQSMDPEALKAEYAQMPPEMLKAHYLACKEALFATMATADPAAAGAPDASAPPAPPAGPPAGPAGAPAPDAPPALKAEKGMTEHPEANGENPLTAVKKSEERIQNLEATLGVLTSAMTKFLSTPVRKSVVSLTELPASKVAVDVTGMSKSEIETRLKEIVRNPALKKSDREKINSFKFGNLKIDQIAHLFVEKN